MVENRLNEIRHKLMIDTQKDFAVILKVTRSQISLWESQQQQPSPKTLIRLWKRLLPYLPDLNLQDLIKHDGLE